MKDLLRIVGLWRARTVWLLGGVVLSLMALGAAVGLSTLGGAAALSGGIATIAVLRAVGVGRVVLRYAERMVSHAAMFRALADVRLWFFRRLAGRSAGGLGFRRTGDMLARLVGDVEALDGLYLRILVPLAGAVLLLPTLAFVLLRTDVHLALLATVLFAIGAFLLPWLSARSTVAEGTRLAQSTAALRLSALDTLGGIREVRAFGAEGRMVAMLQARETNLFAAQEALVRKTALAGTAAFLCGQAAVLSLLLFAGTQPGAAVVAAFLIVAAFEAIGGLPRAGVLAGHAIAAARRVLEAADDPDPLADPTEPAPTPATEDLRFDAVAFRWDPARPWVFDGLTLDIPAGARVAILGPSGVGKSSLAALALKVAAPRQGQILLGGTDIATLPAAEVRSRIGWLSQTTHLFDDTIEANLRLAKPDATESELWEALDAARIGDTVRGLPEGLATWVGEGGTRFSGGQGRRLALARALLSPAPVLILDEPCAGLDAGTEQDFLRTLNDVAPGRTIVLIVHRLTGVERLDRVYRLAGGKAVAAMA